MKASISLSFCIQKIPSTARTELEKTFVIEESAAVFNTSRSASVGSSFMIAKYFISKSFLQNLVCKCAVNALMMFPS